MSSIAARRRRRMMFGNNFGSQAFNPKQIAGLIQWLRADLGLYQDSAMTTPVAANADPVGGWQDQSGQGNDATQTSGGKRPTYRTGQIGGHPALLFDGSDDLLYANAVGTALSGSDKPFTIFLVLRVTTLDANSRDFWSISSLVSTGPLHHVAVAGAATQYRVFRRPDSGSGQKFILDDAADTNVPVILSHVFTGTVGSFWRNNDVQGSLNTDMDVANLTMSACTVGGRTLNSTDQARMAGYLSEVIVYNSALSQSLIDKVEAYLSGRYAIALA